MSIARSLIAVLTIALAGYGVDCIGMATPAHAMGCCEKMRCHSHHHRNQNPPDCCTTTPHVQVVLGQPSPLPTASVYPVMFGLMRAFDDAEIPQFLASNSVGHSHDPPPIISESNLALRI